MNRLKRTAVIALFVSLSTTYSVGASTPSPAQKAKPTPSTASQPQQPDVDIATTFSIETSFEHWALLDPMPTQDVSVGTHRYSLSDRLVNTSETGDGLTQLLFPVSWFEPYQEKNPEIKYVVVKYKEGKACFIMAEYQPERFSLPKDGFEQHPDGKTVYKDLMVFRKDNNIYLKQAISKGEEDGRGGYWVDTMLIYFVERAPAKSTQTAPQAKPKKG